MNYLSNQVVQDLHSNGQQDFDHSSVSQYIVRPLLLTVLLDATGGLLLLMPLIFFTLVAFLASSSQEANAHSTTTRPLKRIGHPSTLSLEILPRLPPGPTSSNPNWNVALPAHHLRFDDSFRLTISAFKETFYIHLRPNDHLVHPAARINYYTTLANGQEVLSHSEPLLRHNIKVYHGEVIAAHHSAVRMREDAARMYPHPHPAVLGWARLMVHDQGDPDREVAPVFEGAFSVNGVIYHIMMKDNYLRNKHELDPDLNESPLFDSNLVIWRDADEMTVEEEHFARTGSHPIESLITPQSCGHDRLDYNLAYNPVINAGTCGLSWIEGLLNPSPRAPRYRRDDAPTGSGGMGTDFRSSIGSVDGCPKTQKVLYMGVAADCTYVSVYGSKEKATTQILNTWNSASSLYKTTFNVSLGISEIQIRDPSCPSTADPNFPWDVPCSRAELDTRLSLFSKWRGDKGVDGVGLWHLMSGCPTGSEVGIAWLGTLCQSTASGRSPTIVSGAAVSTSGRTEWQVVAHEIGHNFGAIHDCNSVCSSSPPCCPLSSDSCSADGRFIMNPVSQSGEKVFSPCSVGNVCSVMGGTTGGRVNTTCLLDPDQARKTISLQMCGNGIVEPGEDCDSGTGVDSNCCDATCKFKNAAKCDPRSSSCCTEACTFAPTNQICRPSRDPKCDTAEFCTGNSSTCPVDITVPNGQKCGDNKLACASGFCTSVSQQCQAVGAPMNLSQGCPDQGDQTCQISCQDPRNPNSCVQLTSLLIDGSPCGIGGSCIGGRCEAAGVLDTFKAWYASNLQISIPVTIVVALAIFGLTYCFVRALLRCCPRKSRAPATPIPRPVGRARLSDRPTRLPTHMRGTSTSLTRAPPRAYGSRSHRDGRHNYASSNRRNWVDETEYNGPHRF